MLSGKFFPDNYHPFNLQAPNNFFPGAGTTSIKLNWILDASQDQFNKRNLRQSRISLILTQRSPLTESHCTIVHQLEEEREFSIQSLRQTHKRKEAPTLGT